MISNDLLRHLDADGLERVANVAAKRSYRQGMYIFSTGEPGDAIFGVISGQVHITARNSRSHELILAVIDPNQVFGEISVIDGLPRCASARAATNVEAFMICGINFRRLVLSDHKLCQGLIEVLCRHQRFSTQTVIDEYAQGNISARLAHRILELTASEDIRTSEHSSLTMTQAELAKFVFVSRQVVNHHLSDWQTRGWISASRGRLVVTDRSALTELVHSGGNGRSRDL